MVETQGHLFTKLLNLGDQWEAYDTQYVKEAHEDSDLSGARQVGADESSYSKRHKYLTVFADMQEKRVIFATKGKEKSTWETFSDDLQKLNESPDAITYTAIDMSPSYQSGVRHN